MQYIATKRVNGAVDITITLSPPEVAEVEAAGESVGQLGQVVPDDTFLGISFGHRTDYVVTEPDGTRRRIHAYGDMHAFVAAASDVDVPYAIRPAEEQRAAA